MLQSSSRNDDAERTDNTHGNYSYLDTKLYGIDFRHHLPGNRLPSVQQAQGQHAQTGLSPYPGFHGMADMLESPPDGSVLPGRQHPADSLHQREYHQYDNNDIGIYIRLLHDVSGDKRLKKVIKNSVSEFQDIRNGVQTLILEQFMKFNGIHKLIIWIISYISSKPI